MTALDHMLIARSQLEMADESNSITKPTLTENASAHLHTALVHLSAAIGITEDGKTHAIQTPTVERQQAMAPVA